MRARIIGPGLLLGLAAAVLTAPAAPAAPDTPYLEAPAGPVAPGEDIEFGGYCASEGVELSSPVLSGFEIAHEPTGPSPNLSASATVDADAQDAIYPVSMTCGGETAGTEFTVVSQRAGEIFITADGSPQPGEEIDVVIRCADEVGGASSPALDIDERIFEIETPDEMPTYLSYARILPDVEPGDHPLEAPCGEETLSTMFTVYPPDPDGSDGAGDGDGDDGDRDGDGGQVSRVPEGAPETGGEPAATGPLAPVLLLGAATAVAGMAPRRGSSRG